MFDEIKKFFSVGDEPETQPLQPIDKIKLAAAAVCIAAARADGVFGVEEIDATLEGLQSKLGVDAAQVRLLFDSASDAYQESPLSDFVSTIKAHMNEQEREAVLAVAWAVIAADGVVTDEETAFAAQLRHALDLTMEQSLRARKSAEHASGDGFQEFVQRSSEVVTATHNRSRGA